MKKVGYRPEIAGAIEAVGSTGGQIMPPVMGVTAFLLAETIGVPYVKICIMAIIPALLYYFGIGVYVHLNAGKLNIVASKAGDEIDIRSVLKRAHMFLGPLIILTVMLSMDFSAMYAAFWAILSTIALGFARKRPMSLRRFVKEVSEGAVTAASICMAIATTGPVIATLTMTGLANLLPALISEIVGGSVALVLIFTLMIAVTLGMGLPTIVSYILTSLYAAPVMVRVGIPLAEAHFCVFIACVSAPLSLPVAEAALTAASLAGSSYLKTANEAMKAGFMLYLLPLLVIWCPWILMRQPSNTFSGGLADCQRGSPGAERQGAGHLGGGHP
jgi:TRAP transporter 4TM/12TM fusion protein